MDLSKDLTRRSFLQGASVATLAAAGLGVVGCAPATGGSGETASAKEGGKAVSGSADAVWNIEEIGEPSETITAQVCVVGGGGTGLAAGVQARQLGLETVLLEKHASTGGSFIGTEGLFGVGSHWQKEAGETVTASDVIEECMDYHHWIPDYEMYKKFFNKTAETIDWLEGIGVEFDHVQALGDSHVCWHIYKGSIHPGVEFMESMLTAAKNVDLDIQTNCAGKRLLLDEEGNVSGVLALRGDDTVVKVEAPVVILATGGYSNNTDLVAHLTGLNPDFLMPSGVDGRDADGIKMAKEIGADLATDPGTMMFYGPVCRGASWGGAVCACTLQPILWVNQDAKRFVREDMFLKNFAFAGLAVKKQRKVWTLCTQALIDRFAAGEGALAGVGVYVQEGSPIEGLSDELARLMKTGDVYTADTIEDLAKKIELDASALEETIATYNEFCSAGLDGDFHKPAKDLVALVDGDGPYYAFDCQDAYFTTCGGLKVTPDTHVLDTEGAEISGLYAGGCDTGGFFGDAYDVGIAAGSGASWAINSGRIAAEQAAKYLS